MPDTLSPPNHKFVGVTVAGVTDPLGGAVAITITGVTQDEPINGLNDGNTCPDGKGVGTDTAMLRAERSGTGNGRVYHVTFAAESDRGRSCVGTVSVCAPIDEIECVDTGSRFDSTGPTCAAGCGDICLIQRSLSTASCPGEPMPRPVKKRLVAARRALGQLFRGSRSSSRATRLGARAMNLLDDAERLTLAGERAGTISPSCAERVGNAIADTDTRTLLWLQAITTTR